MPDEAGFRDAGEALTVIEADRVRVQRRARAASWWYYPSTALLIGMMVGLFTSSNGFWVTPAGLLLLAALSWLQRRQVGVTARLEFSVPLLVITIVLVLVVLGHMLLVTLTIRFGVEQWIPAVAVSAGACMLVGILIIDRVSVLRERRAC